MEEDIFRSIENDYLDTANQIRVLLSEVNSKMGAEKQRTIQRLEKLASNADNQIKQMNMEANSMIKPDIKERLKQRVKTFQTDIQDLKKQIKDAKDSTKIDIAQGRDYLLGGLDASNSLMSSDDYRNRMQNNTQKLRDSSGILDQANTILAETEENAVDTAARVREQGEQIRHTRDRLRDVKSEIQIGGRIIGRMNRRRIMNSLILVAVIIILLAVIGFILYFVIKPLVQPKTAV
jgi:ElaB/YqjD/DUF883 family membrane-anchored ribosome-binding protein